MTRAKFLKIVTGVVGAGAAGYLLYEFVPWLDEEAYARKIRQPLRADETGNPLMRELVRYATLAASGHNAQPWKFTVEDHRIQIHPDLARRLPAVDPNDRELWISLGCALENLTLAARKAGFEPDISYPGANEWIEVNLATRKPEEDTLFSSIPHRQNTRSEYDGRKLGAGEIQRLMSVPVESGISLRAFESDDETEKVLEYVTTGNLHQFGDEAFMTELVQWIRFDKREAMASMDGLYSLCTGNPQVPRWLGKQVLSHMTPQDQADADAKKLRSSAGAIAIASVTDDKAAWVRTGRVYQRLALRLSTMNIRSAFLNQPTEVPEVRGQFQSALGLGEALPQLLIRFGHADLMPVSFRRPVEDVILWM